MVADRMGVMEEGLWGSLWNQVRDGEAGVKTNADAATGQRVVELLEAQEVSRAAQAVRGRPGSVRRRASWRHCRGHGLHPPLTPFPPQHPCATHPHPYPYSHPHPRPHPHAPCSALPRPAAPCPALPRASRPPTYRRNQLTLGGGRGVGGGG